MPLVSSIVIWGGGMGCEVLEAGGGGVIIKRDIKWRQGGRGYGDSGGGGSVDGGSNDTDGNGGGGNSGN